MLQFGHAETARVSKQKHLALTEQLEQYRLALEEVAHHNDYADDEGSINLPADAGLREHVLQCADALATPDLKYIFVIGIGGSNLGTKAVYDALGGSFDTIAPHRPQLIFLDTIAPQQLTLLKELVASRIRGPEEFVCVIISKSGSTAESIFNAELLLTSVRERFGKAGNARVVAITDDGSALAQHADGLNIRTLFIPEKVGGRFSVLSAVGLLPLALAGVSIEELHKGALDMRNACLADSDENAARAGAVALFANYLEGVAVHDMFLFDPRLHSLGLWYRQLLGESVGKEKNREGKVVHTGILPTVSIGSTDLHSVGQLYLGGPKSLFTTFVEVLDAGVPDLSMPHERFFPHLVPMLDGTSADAVSGAIVEGTKIAYHKAELPFAEVALDAVSPYTLGAFMQMHMMQVMYVAVLMFVNAFDQPNVEAYKTETKRILESGA